jgi:PPE-repeat protein
MAAAAAWNKLAAELNSAAASYGKAITSLTNDEWTGPASASMAGAAAPYIDWLSTTSAQAEHAATQARSAAAAYERAHAMTVPPAAIAANRAQLLSLLRTNVLGQNAGAIAATQAQYSEMWAQDSSAMHTYAAHSALATQLKPFVPPPDTTDPAGAATQTAAVSHPTAAKTLASTSKALQSLATPTSATPTPTSPESGLSDSALQAGQNEYGNFINTANLGARGVNGLWRGMSGVLGAAKLAGVGAGGAAKAAGAAAGGAASAAGGLGGLGALGGVSGLGAVTGGMGQAGSLGTAGLSVPPSWAPAAPAAEAAFEPVSGGAWEPIGSTGMMGAVPESAPAGAPGMPGASAAPGMAGMAGRGGLGVPSPRYGVKPIVIPRMPGVG